MNAGKIPATIWNVPQDNSSKKPATPPKHKGIISH